MMRWFLFALAFPLSAAITNVQVSGSTPTQAILSYSAPDMNACTIEVSKSATYTPLVHDVNTALFSGASSDARPGSVTAGRSRVFVLGARTTVQGADGRYYSRALQAETLHYYRITCGSDTATGSFKTANISLGSTHMDPPEADPNRPGQFLWPTEAITEGSEVIDPQTGVLLKRYTKPGAVYGGTMGATAIAVASTPAPTGTGWTTPANVTADDSAYAVYSGTSQDWLWMSLNGGFPYGSTLDGQLSYINFFIKGNCVGATCTTGGQTIQACVTRDKVNCELPIREFSLPASEGTINLTGTGSVKTPGDVFTFDPILQIDWKFGDGKVYNTTGNLTKLYFTSAGDCTRLYAAEQVRIFRTSDNWMYTLTIQSLNCAANPPEVTIDQSLDVTYRGTTGVPFYYPYGIRGNKRFGLLVRKKSTTAASTLNLNYVSWKAASYSPDRTPQYSSGGFEKICSSKPTANGFYHCVNDYQMYGIRTEPGGDLTIRFLGVLYYAGDASKGIAGDSMTFCVMTTAGDILIDDTDPNILYCNGHSSQVNPETGLLDNRVIFVKMAYTGNDIECGQSGATCPAADPEGSEGARWPKLPATLTNLTPCNAPCTQQSDDMAPVAQLKRFTAGWGYAFDKVGFPGCSIQAVSGGYAHLTCQQGQQDSFAWISALDLSTKQIVAANPLFNRKWGRWCTLHTYQDIGYGPVMTPELKYQGGADAFQVTVSTTLSACSKIGGTCSTCPNVTVDGFNYNGRNWCSTLAVTSTWNPAWGAQPGGYATGEPVSSLTNLHWIRVAEVGDIFGEGGEYIKLIQKNSPIQWVVERGFGGDQSWMQPKSHSAGLTWGAWCANDIDTTTSQMSPYGLHWYFLDSTDGSDPASCFFTKYVNHALGRPDVRVRPDYFVSLAPFSNKAAMADTTAEVFVGLPGDFGGKLATTVNGNSIEKHPSFNQVDAPAREKAWFIDAHPLNMTMNSDGTTPAVPVSGDLYRYVLATGYTIDYKYFGTFGMSGQLTLREVSGPNSTITGTSSDAYKFCIAHRANECVSGSTAGQFYFNVPVLEEKYCHQGETYTGYHDVCLDNFAVIGSSVAQWMLPPDSATRLRNGEGTRVLSRLRTPYRAGATWNAKPTPDGGWVFGLGRWIAKIPAWPPRDSTNRSNFIPVPVQLKPPSGLGVNNAIVEFGYDANFYCTSRAEACVKDANASEPYVFAGDTITGVSCASGCTINIPAISGRVLYYRWKYRNAANAPIGDSSIMVVPVP